jgi:hypothetical protein
MSDTPYADRAIVKQCGVCMRLKPVGILHRQYGAPGTWYCCQDCFDAIDRGEDPVPKVEPEKRRRKERG